MQVLLEAIDSFQTDDLKFNFKGAGTTGSGRKFVASIIGADIALDEITAHARAAYELDNDVDTIIEIGGQDAKFTTLKNGMVTFSIMNNVCAAGTGSFIEEQAEKLNCSLSDYSMRTEKVAAPLSSDRCTVFMERDINHYLSEGYSVNEVLASVLHSIRENYLTKVAVESSIGEKIFFQGATAKNKALVAAFEQKLNKEIMVSKYCHLTGAIGVALHMIDNEMRDTKFKGISLYKKSIPIRTEVCEICTNHCKIKIADINNEEIAFGFLCGRDYKTQKFISVENKTFDFLKERKKVFNFKHNKINKSDFTIGLPAALHMVEDINFWEKFFDLLSVKTVTSENYKDVIKTGKQYTGAEFCAPLTGLHGAVKYLEDKADYIFLPVYLEIRQDDLNFKKNYCYYTQYSASLIKSNSKIINPDKILDPLIKSLYKSFYVKGELYKMFKNIKGANISFFQVSNAYDNAMQYFNSAKSELNNIFDRETKDLGEPGIVFIGRPYTALVKSMNNDIPEIFNKLKVKTFFQDMVKRDENNYTIIDDLQKEIHWKYVEELLDTAEVVCQSHGLYPVLITSFKCTPDSYSIDYFKKIMDKYNKPYLILQLDELDSNVGYETRIEAGVRAFKNHFNSNQKINRPDKLFLKEGVIKNKSTLKGKTLLLPNWNYISGKLLESVLTKEGIKTRLLKETDGLIQKSMSLNSGQCIPVTVIAQEAIEYIKENNLRPEDTALWTIDSKIACNIGMFPVYLKNILSEHGLEEVKVYSGSTVFVDISMRAAINSYFAYMFSGLLIKAGCKIRPYENIKGSTDKVIEKSIELLSDMFLYDKSKEDTIKHITELLKEIKTTQSNRPKVAIFGDIYVRDNDIMNQNLIKVIEDNGGEAITTPYHEYLQIISKPYIRKWYKESNYGDVAISLLLKNILTTMDKKYAKYFNDIIGESKIISSLSPKKMLNKFNLLLEQTGESQENILKIFYLIENYPDISLFVQTNPSYCAPSLVTEAMADKIESITGVPIVTIEYDGTGGNKNDDIIPYLKFPRKTGKGKDENKIYK